MDTATRIPPSPPEAADRSTGAAGPLDAVLMSPHERRQAEIDMRAAEQLVDLLFAVAAGWQALVRRVRLAH